MRVFFTLGLAVFLVSCGSTIEYSQYEGYLHAARGTWPLVFPEPFPARFTNEDARRFHAAITARTGLKPEGFVDYRGFFLAANREIEREQVAKKVAAAPKEEILGILTESRAIECVRGYLGALLREEPTRGFWVSGEPPRAFDRLLEHGDPRSAAAVDVEVPSGPIPCRSVPVRCRVADLKGRIAERGYVFLVTLQDGRPALWDVRVGI